MREERKKEEIHQNKMQANHTSKNQNSENVLWKMRFKLKKCTKHKHAYEMNTNYWTSWNESKIKQENSRNER